MGNEQSDKPKRKLTLTGVIAWIVGIGSLLTGIGSISSSLLAGIILILIAIILIPPISKIIENKLNFSLSRGLKIVLVLILFVVAGVSASSSNSTNNPVSQVPENSKAETKTEEIETSNTIADDTVIEEPVKQSEPASTPKVENTYQPTMGEKNAVKSAKNYLSYTAFSRSGLIKQLEYEGYSRQEAEYGVSQTNADWNEQAFKSAQNYIEYTAFSRSGLIEQLEYEGFTRQQAEYGADAVGY